VNAGVETGTIGSTPTNWAAAPSGGTVVMDGTTGEFASGAASAKITTTTTTNTGAKENLSAALSNSGSAVYLVSFSVKGTGTAIPNANLQVTYLRNGTTADNNCTPASNATISTTAWIKFTCLLTPSTTSASSGALEFVNNNTTAYNFFVDNVSIVLQNSTGAQDTGDIQVGGVYSQGLTLITLDSSASAPWTSNGNTSLLGSMYYDTTVGRIQCYEADGWGACGASPTQQITLTAEYPGAVLNGSGTNNTGTMTANLCANSGASGAFQNGTTNIEPDASLCASGEFYSYYRWTTTQSANAQSFDIYLRYQLPSTFKTFSSAPVVTARTTDSTNGPVTVNLYDGGTSCGSSAASSSNNAWQSLTPGSGSCTFAAGDFIMIKIDLAAKSSSISYASNIQFTMTGK
jgi:hypothetical protein